MPTGLTGNIYEGKDMTLRGFALRCVTQTGFGCTWTERGERAMPLDKPPVMKENGYHRKALHQAEEELARWQRLKDQPEKLQREYDAYCTKVELENIGRDKRYDEKHDRYQAMIDKVMAWQVTEQYQPLKELMLRQLRESMEYDCRDKEHRYYDHIAPMDEWLKTNIECCHLRIERYKERVAEDKKYVRDANEYFKGLYALLDAAEPMGFKVENGEIVELNPKSPAVFNEMLDRPITDYPLSVRALNCLKSADINTLRELVRLTEMDLLKFRNFGKKSISELSDFIKDHDLTWGMNV